jgi:hypothetical protein
MRAPVSLAQPLAWFRSAVERRADICTVGGDPSRRRRRRRGRHRFLLLQRPLYFDAAHDFPHVCARVCRALGLAAIVLGLGDVYVAFPDLIPAGNLASHALMLTLVAVLGIRFCVYPLAKREPFRAGSSSWATAHSGSTLRARSAADPTSPSAWRASAPSRRTGPSSAPRRDSVDSPSSATSCAGERPDHIIVALGDRRGSLPVTDLLACRFRGVRVEEGSQALERVTHRLAVESLSPSALIFGDGFRVSRLQLGLKHASSRLIAVVSLVVRAPVMPSYNFRHEVRPGLTQHCSLGFDLRIISSTPSSSFSAARGRDEAYQSVPHIGHCPPHPGVPRRRGVPSVPRAHATTAGESAPAHLLRCVTASREWEKTTK